MELKNCPFCDGKEIPERALIGDGELSNIIQRYIEHRTTCMILKYGNQYIPKRAVEAWNTRTDTKPLAMDRVEIIRLLENLRDARAEILTSCGYGSMTRDQYQKLDAAIVDLNVVLSRGNV